MPDVAAPPTAPAIMPTEIIHVDSRTAACDGGDGALGHPRVFLRIADEQVMCPYCSRLYVLNPERITPADIDIPEDIASDIPAEAETKRLHLILIDGSGFIFRAFHALPPMTRPDGTPVNAVFGFTNMLAKLLKEHVGTHIAVIFDAGRLTFRNRLYDAYKAHRPPPPEELIPQFALIREATEAFGVPAIELADWEADDLIAAYTLAATNAGGQVTIVSSDKDLMQLIRPGVDMLDPIKQKPIGPVEVMEKFGVTPDKMVEVQALIGDATDNVPGVPGIGPKGAAQLINEFGDVEAVLAAAPGMKPSKRREMLIEHAAKARISRELVLLREDTPMPVPVENWASGMQTGQLWWRG